MDIFSLSFLFNLNTGLTKISAYLDQNENHQKTPCGSVIVP